MRTIILNLSAAATLDDATANHTFSRVQDAWQGVEWRLCRRPTDGIHRRLGYHVYKQSGIRELNVPTIVALYTFNDDTVTIAALSFYAA
jgi:hypothetical protein